MALKGDEIRANLSRFAAYWSQYERSERSEAQTFLNELFACYGTERKDVADFEAPQQGRFVDLLWSGVCLFEMKAPGESGRLAKHRPQAIGYWENAADPAKGTPAPPYMVVCSFHRFEIFEPGRFPKEPRLKLSIEELPERYDALLFLAGSEPVFRGAHKAVTVEAVEKVSELSRRLAERGEGAPDEQRRFILQCVWCMFAEDLGQIPGHGFSRILEQLINSPSRSSVDDLGRLFDYLDDPAPSRPKHGLYAGVPYANGRLFEEPAALHLDRDELELVLEAARDFNWHEVEPSIFGSLLEGVFGHEKQWELGAHYTHEADIQKIVQPTVVAPWRERIAALSTHREALAAQEDLRSYVVLDPACGSGNFLYVAYRELRRIERDLAHRIGELARAEGKPEGASLGVFPLENIKGLELDSYAVSLARVTLWMAHKLANEELGLGESTLPLADLSGIRVADALRVDWPAADAIIGNPPFHGSQNLRQVLPEPYVKWLSERFNCGLKDLCVYWFRRAADQMRPGDRAGLVGTNSVSQNRARGASLNYVVEKGGVITNAVPRQKWPGEAVVNVSIVNWVHQPKQQPASYRLGADEAVGISTRLRESKLPVEEYEPLGGNKGRAFQGPIPAGDFYLETDEAETILARPAADYAAVVRPYLIGDDITEEPAQQPRRYVIDFAGRTLEQAMEYPEALKIVRERVKPKRDENRDAHFRKYWWRFGRPRGEMRDAIADLPRYIAGNRIGKRFLYCWAEASVCPSDLTIVFAFDDDYAMGVLTSSVHREWARAEASTLRVDLRYTPTTCFETFPWPDPTPTQRERIGSLARELIDERQAICAEREIGLTDLYNLVDDGAFEQLAKLHGQLDAAVAASYGWTAEAARDPLDVRARLVELHRRISTGELAYAPFGE